MKIFNRLLKSLVKERKIIPIKRNSEFKPRIWTIDGELMPFMRKIIVYSYSDRENKSIVCCPSCEGWTVSLVMDLEDFDIPIVVPAEPTEKICEICGEIF